MKLSYRQELILEQLDRAGGNAVPFRKLQPGRPQGTGQAVRALEAKHLVTMAWNDVDKDRDVKITVAGVKWLRARTTSPTVGGEQANWLDEL